MSSYRRPHAPPSARGGGRRPASHDPTWQQPPGGLPARRRPAGSTSTVLALHARRHGVRLLGHCLSRNQPRFLVPGRSFFSSQAAEQPRSPDRGGRAARRGWPRGCHGFGAGFGASRFRGYMSDWPTASFQAFERPAKATRTVGRIYLHPGTYSARSVVAGSVRSARITGGSAASNAAVRIVSVGTATIVRLVAFTS